MNPTVQAMTIALRQNISITKVRSKNQSTIII